MSVEVELAQVVNSVVKRYASRCWWADADELRQEAWVAAMDAHRGWRPEKGPIGPYAQVTVRRHVVAFLLHETSPVSASWHARHNLIPLTRAGLTAEPSAAQGAVHERPELVAPTSTWADALLDDARWHVRVLARLLELLGPNGEHDLDLLAGETKRIGRPPFWLMNLNAAQRQTLAQDDMLKTIWEERS